MMKRRPFLSAVGGFGVGAAVPGAIRAQPAPYKLGVTIALTGPLAPFFAEAKYALVVAAEDVNRSGGIKGRSLQLLFEDSKGTPEAGIAAMRKLVQVDGVPALMSTLTNVINAQIPLSDQLKVPVMSTIETPGILGKSWGVFAHSATIGEVAPHISAYWKRTGMQKIYGFMPDNGYGHFLDPILRQIATEAGSQYDSALLDLGQTDYRGLMARARDDGPQGIIISVQGSTIEGSVIRQLREMNITAPVFIVSNSYADANWRASAGPYAEGVIFTGLNVDMRTSPGFVKAFRGKTGGSSPTQQAAQMYDVIKMLAFAIERVGTDSVAIRDQIATIKNVPSVFGGTITMGADHYTIPSGIGLWQVQRGALAKVG